jgi:hypothetical protein
MAEQATRISDRKLRTPRAAAIAGIVFALLYSAGYAIIQISLPSITAEAGVFLEQQAKSIALGLSLVPFAGIAFLWFMGVIRDLLGELEDQFFSTLFLASGILYLGMIFISAAIAGGILTAVAINPDLVTGSEGLLIARTIADQINAIYAVRMAGMFMLVLGTIWVRTQLMPRWLALVTYALALVLLVSIGFSHWVTLAFPAWVFLTSVYIMVLNYRRVHDEKSGDGLSLND